MQALIDFIIRNLMALWPISRVDEWEHGIMMRNGRIHRKLLPGLHWRWLFIEELKTAWSTEMNVDLNHCTFTTTCGKTVVASANVSYKIADMSQLWRTLVNSNETIRNLAIGFLAAQCAGYSWAELNVEREDIEETLREHLEERLSDKGLEIMRVQLTDLAICKMLRLFGDGHRVV